ncbi:hypothetical protein OH76DRAFT_385587 [Lentinus brumalis]|uniref:Uncharacterized protein n=1 Tax=Lentinus brumalis TaxID=2498619 RepID=A0A371DVB9_9APHY|nr:hypothetical protein OH76DRAFT_385587 [Polyporus brumalis]
MEHIHTLSAFRRHTSLGRPLDRIEYTRLLFRRLKRSGAIDTQARTAAVVLPVVSGMVPLSSACSWALVANDIASTPTRIIPTTLTSSANVQLRDEHKGCTFTLAAAATFR